MPPGPWALFFVEALVTLQCDGVLFGIRTGIVFRWIVTMTIALALMANGPWLVSCKAPASSTVSAGDDVPDCCRHGLCPHHAKAQHVANSQKNAADDCICKLTAPDSVTIVALTNVVSTMPATEMALGTLNSVGAVFTDALHDPALPDLSPLTPPPRA